MVAITPIYEARTFIMLIILIVSCCYVFPILYDRHKLHPVGDLEGFGLIGIRTLFLLSLLIPTYFQARTLGYLSEIIYYSGFGSNLFVTTITGCFLQLRMKYRPEFSHLRLLSESLYVFYGCVFWVTAINLDLVNILRTGGPFLLSSGTLFLAHADQQQFIQFFRQSSRRTLRDMVITISNDLREDILLQITMFRWIVDYWSTSQIDVMNSTSSSSFEPASTVPCEPVRVEIPSEKISSIRQNCWKNSSMDQQDHIDWCDIFPMLNVVTTQMEKEVHLVSNKDCHLPFDGLRQMLAKMDVDEYAHPAVQAYKKVVEKFPPNNEIGFAISVLSRCPAILLLLRRYSIASALALTSSFTLLPFLLLDFIRVQLWINSCFRFIADAGCNESIDPIASMENMYLIPAHIDSMTLLLSSDSFTPRKRSILHQVWINIQSSVGALEAGLTTARCVNTAAAAADIAANFSCLAELGQSITQKGWMHGLSLLLTELFLSQSGPRREGTYTQAALSLIENGKKVSTNFQSFTRDREHFPFWSQLLLNNWWNSIFQEKVASSNPQHNSGDKLTLTTQREDIQDSSCLTTHINSHPDDASLLDDRMSHDEFNESINPVNIENSGIEVVGEFPKQDDIITNNLRMNDRRNFCLSDVSNLIAIAYEKGLINDVTKSAFESMLIEQPSIRVLESLTSSLIDILKRAASQEPEIYLKEDDAQVVQNLNRFSNHKNLNFSRERDHQNPRNNEHHVESKLKNQDMDHHLKAIEHLHVHPVSAIRTMSSWEDISSQIDLLKLAGSSRRDFDRRHIVATGNVSETSEKASLHEKILEPEKKVKHIETAHMSREGSDSYCKNIVELSSEIEDDLQWIPISS
jgi:hypothetical protein